MPSSDMRASADLSGAAPHADEDESSSSPSAAAQGHDRGAEEATVPDDETPGIAHVASKLQKLSMDLPGADVGQERAGPVPPDEDGDLSEDADSDDQDWGTFVS